MLKMLLILVKNVYILMIWQLVCLVSRQNILTKVLICDNNNNIPNIYKLKEQL